MQASLDHNYNKSLQKKMQNLQEVITMQFWFNPQVFHSFLFTKPEHHFYTTILPPNYLYL